MERQILLSLSIIGVAVVAASAGTYAFFTSNASSSNNVFTAGTLDLRVNDTNALTAQFVGNANFLPGDSASGFVTLKQAGTVDPSRLQLGIAFNDTGGSSASLEKYLNVSALSYNGADLLSTGGANNGPCFTDKNSNGFVDVADLKAQACNGLAAPSSSGVNLNLTVKFDTSASDPSLQGASATLVAKFLLSQSSDPTGIPAGG